jgi:putative colanic acid biosynthesis acetyltransferase WcaF
MPSARIWAPWNLELGDECTISFQVDCYNAAPISIGSHTTVSQYAHLCTAGHDIADRRFSLVAAPIRIGNSAWICAGAYVGKGVTVRDGAVVAAHAVVTRDVPAWTVVGGNPAQTIKQRVLKEETTA